MDVVVEEIRALLSGDAGRLPAPVPFREYVARARLGVPRRETMSGSSPGCWRM